MAVETEVWRAALQAKGRDWVLAELHTRPGQPQDPVYDVVFEPPYPTRDFCQRWSVDEDNKYLRMAGSTKIALCVLVVFVVFLGMAVRTWTQTEAALSRHASSHSIRQ